MRRIMGKVVRHLDGRSGYVLGRNPAPGYFNVIAMEPGKGVTRTMWSVEELDQQHLVRQLGLGGDDGSVQAEMRSAQPDLEPAGGVPEVSADLAGEGEG
jgi:hypothetical protein